jgi:lipopolysaccharide export system protein LptA
MTDGRIMLALTIAAVGAAATLAASQPAAAQAAAEIFAGFQAKSTDPIQVDADLLEVYEEEDQRIAVFSGNVQVHRGATTLTAKSIKLFSDIDSAVPTSDAFTRIEAGGGIRVSSGGQTVTGAAAIVDMRKQTITVSGGVVLTQGANVITGRSLVVNLATGRARIEQEPGRQIRGVFTPGGDG